MKDLQGLELDIAFWTGFYDDDKKDPVGWASNKAYLDMNRTMTFRESDSGLSEEKKRKLYEKRNSWRDDATGKIREQLKQLSGDKSFKKWHEDTCGMIRSVYAYNEETENDSKLVQKEGRTRSDKAADLTFGQAQKWLNMTLKYLWLLDRFDLLNDPDLKNIIETHQKNFHVPLDSYILRFVQKKKKDGKRPEETGLSENCDLPPLCCEWSKIVDTENYYLFQQKIGKDLGMQNSYPLEWELKYWHKAVQYYG